MPDAEGMRFKITIPGDRRTVTPKKALTIKELLTWIDEQPHDPEIIDKLKKMAKAYPHNALANFKKNFKTHLYKAQKQ